jgi:hypothetical protein
MITLQKFGKRESVRYSQNRNLCPALNSASFRKG